jgi:predicted NAD/FAD-binding protein
VLHTDERLLPRNRRAWASWNYHVRRADDPAATVTYNMNLLQGLRAPSTYCVTLNESDRVARERVLHEVAYEHPVFRADRATAGNRQSELIRRNRTSFCGAYWGYGFHEDGVKSALAVTKAYGETLQ